MNKTKRYSLVIKEPLFDDVQQQAEEDHTTVLDLLRRYIKLGLYFMGILKNPDACLIIKKDEKEQEILFL